MVFPTNSQTFKRRIDPCILCPGTGIDFHPFATATEVGSTARPTATPSIPIAKVSTTNHATIMQDQDYETMESDSTSLDIYVLPSGMSPEHAALWKNQTKDKNKDETATEPFLHLRMDRNSNEFVNKTLERMAVSLNKQVSKRINKPKKGKQQRRNSRQQNINDTTGELASIWKVSAGQSNTTVDIHNTSALTPQYWDVQGLTNQEVWSNATTPLSVYLPLQNNITLSLRVDACPPTIVLVDTFEDFSSRIFCDVPLVVQVQTLFATDTKMDWYVGDQQVQSNICNCSNDARDTNNGNYYGKSVSSYTPQLSDIGKQVSLLITPLRRTQNAYHTGQGYEEAYQFEYSVEALPENTVVKLRHQDKEYDWTNPHRRKTTPESMSEKSETRQTASTVQPLRVMTFNILADQNAYKRNTSGHKQIPCYPYVSAAVLDKCRRMPLLLHEILSYQADVICLQEVDESVWRGLFRPALEQAGYQGYFSGKISKGTSEGCAMLWSLHRFEALSEDDMKHYVLSKLILDIADNHAQLSPEWTSSQNIGQVLKDKPDLRDVIENKLGHIVQMVSLVLRKDQTVADISSSSTPDRLLVANTHLFFHPLAAHIRLMQMYGICRTFEQFQQRQQSNQLAASYPMILCGDMNSSLRRAAGYLLIQRQVQPDHAQIPEHFNRYEWKDRRPKAATVGGPPSGFNGTSIQANNDARIEHTEPTVVEEDHWEDFPPIELPAHFPSFLTGYPTEPVFTHYLDQFVGSLDHIFISQCSEQNLFGLAPFQSAPMPSVEDVTEQVAMPSEKLPSDHVSLVADLEFTKYN